jgi:hypothetical protein
MRSGSVRGPPPPSPLAVPFSFPFPVGSVGHAPPPPSPLAVLLPALGFHIRRRLARCIDGAHGGDVVLQTLLGAQLQPFASGVGADRSIVYALPLGDAGDRMQRLQRHVVIDGKHGHWSERFMERKEVMALAVMEKHVGKELGPPLEIAELLVVSPAAIGKSAQFVEPPQHAASGGRERRAALALVLAMRLRASRRCCR